MGLANQRHLQASGLFEPSWQRDNSVPVCEHRSEETPKMFKPLTLLTIFAIAAPAVAQEQKNIAATIAEAREFQTLYSALSAADLTDALQGEGPFTLFAPTDEAFAKLPKETLEGLLKDENKEKLVEILKLHILPARVPAADVLQKDGQEVETLLEGCKVKVSVQDDTVKIGEAQVIKADHPCSNGVIHIIDRVLMPEKE